MRVVHPLRFRCVRLGKCSSSCIWSERCVCTCMDVWMDICICMYVRTCIYRGSSGTSKCRKRNDDEDTILKMETRGRAYFTCTFSFHQHVYIFTQYMHAHTRNLPPDHYLRGAGRIRASRRSQLLHGPPALRVSSIPH